MTLIRWRRAFQFGLRTAWQNRIPIVVIQALVGLVVSGYYLVAPVSSALAVLGRWQERGGVWFAAGSNALAGGLLSEVVLVYALQAGIWTLANRGQLVFKVCLFGVNGAIAFEFYRLQSHLFGSGHDCATVLKKVAVDQFVFSVFWATPFQAIVTQWRNHSYSWTKTCLEVSPDLLWDQMLMIMAMTWMFWLPTITLVYLMPSSLQMPLAVFSTAIWAILLVAVSAGRSPCLPEPGKFSTRAKTPG